MNKKYRHLINIFHQEQMVSAGISGTYETLAGSGKNFFDSHMKEKSKKKKDEEKEKENNDSNK